MPHRPWWLWLAAAVVALPNAVLLAICLGLVGQALLFGVESLKGMSGPGVMGCFVAPIPMFLILRCEWYAVVRGSPSAAMWIVVLAGYFVLLGIPPAVVGILQLAGLLRPSHSVDAGEGLIATAVLWSLAVPIGLAHRNWRRILEASPGPPS